VGTLAGRLARHRRAPGVCFGCVSQANEAPGCSISRLDFTANGRGSQAMSIDKMKLLLAELEVEVVQEALELYVQTRPVPNDRRFEYRYRAARSVLKNLRQGTRELGALPRGVDEEATVIDDEPPERRPLRERLED
jgi:hypothetical protein